MSTVKRRMLLPLTAVLAALGLMVAAQIAGATHAHPKGASPLRVPLVPAYNVGPTEAHAVVSVPPTGFGTSHRGRCH